ncbi:MAG: chemotaxis protein CheW [Nitrospiria bacterium]
MEEDSILQEFLVECAEGLDRLDQEFVTLEKEPDNTALLGSIFRTVHTIKGTCGFLGLPKLENVAHGAENILSAMRDKKLDVTPAGITVLLDAVDVIKEILEQIEATSKEPEKDYSGMRKELDDFLAGGGVSTTASVAAEVVSEEAAALAEIASDFPDATPEELAEIAKMTGDLDAPLDDAPTLKSKIVEESEPAKNSEIVNVEATPSRSGPPTEEEAEPAAASPPPPVATQKPAETTEEKPVKQNKPKRSLADSSIRVDVDLLDKLINMVGELVLARNQLLQQVRDREEGSSAESNNGTIQQLNLITTELQDTVMKTRMQQIKNVWDKFPRVVRDLARSNGKEIELVMEGAETELDKTLLEAIKDPMTHIVRNAADHGIEKPEVRAERGKPQKGTLLLKAFHEGGQIIIEISDDGAGIDVERVKQKAVDNGLISADVAARMPDREAFALIFSPGLSTAKKVTNVSGRGVGMDVVKTNIEKIGGTVDMSSRVGEGTHMRIKIPLTLAIIPALMVTSGDEPFAIPQASLRELVRVDEGNSHQIEVIHGAHFYRLRGVLLPLLSLNCVLKLDGHDAFQKNLTGAGTNIVVLKAGDHSFGLVVDAVNDSEEIVVKPLSRQLKGLHYLAGATIMGDGRVALILDVMGVAEAGGLLGADGEHGKEEISMESGHEKGFGADRETMILFSVSGEDRYAIPLSEIARLEEFDATNIEQSAGTEVIQYRDELLPLIRLGDSIGVMTSEENTEKLPAIVFSRNEKSIGLVVGRIIDIVKTDMILHAPPAGKLGVKGSLVIDGLTTDLLDIDQVVESAVPEWFESAIA